MERREFLGVLGGWLTAWPLTARAQESDQTRRIPAARTSDNAQQPTNIPHIGLLCATSPKSVAGRIEAFRQGLRELGYQEGKNISVEIHSAHGNFGRLPALATELVSHNVSLIVTLGGIDTRAAKSATSTIPIVMLQDPDPIASGFVTSLARPGGNITGLSRLTREIGGKRLELLEGVAPKLTRLAVIGSSSNPINAQALREVEVAATARGLTLQYLDVLSADDIEHAFRAAVSQRADALLQLPGPVVVRARKKITNLAAKHGLPAIYDRREFVEAGGLISYGASVTDLARRGATYVDKILKGAMPADLPIELPTKFELLINLKAAEALGITFSQLIRLQATDVIE